jgi:hypothetical protein
MAEPEHERVFWFVPKEARFVLAALLVGMFYICGVQEELTVTGWVNFIGTMAGECLLWEEADG